MITIRCTHSQCEDKNFETTFYKNLLIFGKSSSCDIIISENEIPNLYLSIEVNSESIYIYPSPQIDYFLYNTSKTTHQKRVFINDSFSIGKFTFELLNAQFIKKTSINKIVNAQTEKILKNPLWAKRIKEIHERI